MKKNTYWHNQSLDICNKCELKENNSTLFSNLLNDSIDKISHCYSIIPSNEIIYKQDDTDHYMYAIKNGIIGGLVNFKYQKGIIKYENKDKEQVL